MKGRCAPTEDGSRLRRAFGTPVRDEVRGYVQDPHPGRSGAAAETRDLPGAVARYPTTLTTLNRRISCTVSQWMSKCGVANSGSNTSMATPIRTT